jgi:DNA-binding HxlR family transcriptional regulator
VAEKPRLDPLRNVGTSRVLYALLEGPNTPTELSKSLRVAPPGVMQQLHRLERIGVVRRGEKRGKSQYYEVVEDGVVKLFLDALEGWVQLWMEARREMGEKEPTPSPREMAEVRNALAKNGCFRRLVRAYLRRKPHQKIFKAVDDFTSDVAWFSRRLAKKKIKDKEALEFLATIKKVEKWTGESSIATMDALMEAMEKAGLR